jgi:hypothetical protein
VDGVCNVQDDAGVLGALAAVGTFGGCHGLDAGFDQIFDMSGNAAEMDDWATDYSAEADASGVTVHTRGGAYDYGYRACTDRIPHPVLWAYDDVGFRCCADVAP